MWVAEEGDGLQPPNSLVSLSALVRKSPRKASAQETPETFHSLFLIIIFFFPHKVRDLLLYTGIDMTSNLNHSSPGENS